MAAGDTVTAPSHAADTECASASNGQLRILLAERRASAQSELSRRLTRLGHEVMARVTSGQGAMDYASFLAPDAVLLSPVLEDMSGVAAAMAITRKQPGIAAVLLSSHPAAADPAARPNWGAVAVVPTDAEPEDLDAALRRAVGQAREAAGRPEAVDAPAGAPRSSSQESAPSRDLSAADAGALTITGAGDAETLNGAADAAADAADTDTADDAADESTLVARAIEVVMERAGVSRDQARRLMQEEADDTAQTLVEVARAMLDDDTDTSASGELVAAA